MGSNTPNEKPVPVLAAFLEEKGRVFLALRSEGRMRSGTWEFPGGKQRPKESEEACLKREFLEEFGIIIDVGDELARIEYTYPDIRILLILRRAGIVHGYPVPREHEDIRWVKREELDGYRLSPADKNLLTILNRHEHC